MMDRDTQQTIRRLQAENARLREALGDMLGRHILYCGGEGLPFAGHTNKALLESARRALGDSHE